MTTLTQLRQLHQQASPPPWLNPYVEADTAEITADPLSPWWNYYLEQPDAELIAAMRNALPHLLDIAEAAQRAAYPAPFGPHDDNDVRRMRELREALARLETA